jgi:acyl-CoA dehydrogenase
MDALIPQEYGGSGLGLAEAYVITEEINRAGGNSSACHGQIYNRGPLLHHGSTEQKQRYLPQMASGALRLQSMGVTEPSTGTDATKIKTTAVRRGDRYVINGRKVWISRVEHSDLMILFARTGPRAVVQRTRACRSSSSICVTPSAGAWTRGRSRTWSTTRLACASSRT